MHKDAWYYIPSASSQALPAPNPNPTHAGHALRLNRRTEKTMPKEAPRVERMRKEEIAWSHFERPNQQSLIGIGDGAVYFVIEQCLADGF